MRGQLAAAHGMRFEKESAGGRKTCNLKALVSLGRMSNRDMRWACVPGDTGQEGAGGGGEV
jgi:hypothetical protein